MLSCLLFAWSARKRIMEADHSWQDQQLLLVQWLLDPDIQALEKFFSPRILASNLVQTARVKVSTNDGLCSSVVQWSHNSDWRSFSSMHWTPIGGSSSHFRTSVSALQHFQLSLSVLGWENYGTTPKTTAFIRGPNFVRTPCGPKHAQKIWSWNPGRD